MSEHQSSNPDDLVPVRVTAYGTRPAYHVRDAERRHEALPPCELPAADRGALVPVRLATFPATVWLPASATADPMVPEPWESWDWPSGASVLIEVERDPLLPRLHGFTGELPGARCAVVGGRPMQVDRRGPDETGRDFRGWVRGFLTDRARLYAAVAAPSAAERDGLLSAVLTLESDAEAPEGLAPSAEGA